MCDVGAPDTGHERREAAELAAIARDILAALTRPPAGASPAVLAVVWRQAAPACRRLAQREVLRDTLDAPGAADRRRRLAEMAVRLAVNAEWAAVVCDGHTTPITSLPFAAARDWARARDALRHTTLGILLHLPISHGITT
ncbi:MULTISPECIES: hypothetical protein [unclassified Spirillospora]|uniref:hypothetical protein n=1 Tax=unclassified Spirillospora TaxID=2642701 RepID=UPI003710E80E